MYKNWKHKSEKIFDFNRLQIFEKEICGTQLPKSFREWLEHANGGKPEQKNCLISDDFGAASIHHVFGLNDGPGFCQIDEVNKILSGNLNEGVVAFADDELGNYFAVSIREADYGAIIFWDHETGAETQISRDFEGFDNLLFSEEASFTELEKILRADDVSSLKSWLGEKDVNIKNDLDRSPLEEAAIYGSLQCIEFLHSVGALPFSAKVLAQNNLEFFPEHKETVELLDSLY